MKSRIGAAIAMMTMLMAIGAGAATGTNNNDSCDISTAPAATLLLPYFEVDLYSPVTTAQTTLFTVVNTSRTPQIARVTLWTDLGYPALNFNLFLTGYDVQSINLYDIFGPQGAVAGTTSSTRPGERSLPNSDNSHFAHGATHVCETNAGPLPADILQDIRSAFTNGVIYRTCGNARIGYIHSNAIGYATIDVVRTCDDTFPNTTSYYAELLYDLIGYCQGEPLLPETSSTSVSSGKFPAMSSSGDIAGWIYLNLNNRGSAAYSKPRASRNWVTVTMSAEGRYSLEFDAAALVNGCTPARPKGATIGPNP